MTKEEVIEKIKKLLALSESPVEAEAQLALAKARELTLRWAIEEHELHGGQKTEFVEVTFFKGRRRPFKVKLIMNLLDNYFNVKTLTIKSRIRGATIVCFGTKSNVEFAQYVDNYLSQTFENLWLRFQHQFGLNETFKKRYFMGLHQGFVEYLESQRIPEETGTALIVLGKGLQRACYTAHPNTYRQLISVSERDSIDRVVFGAGMRDGKKIRVSRSVEAGSKKQIGG